jgi:hypothetical protein
MIGFAHEYGTFPALLRTTIVGHAPHGALVERLIQRASNAETPEHRCPGVSAD